MPRSDDEPELRLAILIDADNTPHMSVKSILDTSARYGRIVIKRAYGDWTIPTLQHWGDIFREFSIRPIQQFQYTSGKNSTDSALIIDAMDILHQKRVDSFVLVTSDSDFAGLATRIREEGLAVIGMGRQTTPSSFVKACDEFIPIENLTVSTPGPTKTRIPKGGKPDAGIGTTKLDQGRELLVRAIQQAIDENGFVKGAKLGVMLKRLDPAFSPFSFGVGKLADFLDLYPELITLQGRRVATDPTYRVVATQKS